MSGIDSLSKGELQELLEMLEQVSAETDQQRLVRSILETACRMTGSPDGSVLLFDAERNGLFFAAAQGGKAQELMEGWGEHSNQRVPLAGSNAGRAFTSGTIVVDEQSDRFVEVDRQIGARSQSILSVPLRVRGRTIGVLQTLNKVGSDHKLTNYSPKDCVVIEQLARQAAIAIDNAQLIAKLLAHMGLYSRQDATDLVERVNQPAQRERVTLLFADMRGFTQLCQSQEIIQTQKIVDDLLTMFADQVLVFSGIVNKFLGDAVFAIFRGSEGPQQAVRCAFKMLERFQSLRYDWDRICNEDLSFLDLGIGIVTGEVALGSIGNASVRDFTAIGTPVNLANAFQAAARNGKRILIDQATWNAVQDIVADAEGPTAFELRKPGQDVGVKFRRYELKQLKPEIPVRVFVSHSHEDRDFANDLTKQLARCGIETWYSPANIIPAENYIESIRDGLIKSDWVIVIVSSHSSKSDWVRAEVNTAADDPRFRSRILPIKLDDSDTALISHQISTVQAVDGRTVLNLGEAIRDLLVLREKDLHSKAVRS
jgi:class 3 adenylate cyclase